MSISRESYPFIAEDRAVLEALEHRIAVQASVNASLAERVRACLGMLAEHKLEIEELRERLNRRGRGPHKAGSSSGRAKAVPA